jgi:hypothetical protein
MQQVRIVVEGQCKRLATVRRRVAAASTFVPARSSACVVSPGPAVVWARYPHAYAGTTPYYYTTRQGRASLEFRAARIMASYVGTHRDARVYYEDDDLIIYQLQASAVVPHA